MSGPSLNPEQTPAGIALNPWTLERVVPESRRPDGSVRKERKIRPGFTPQEDVKLFQPSPAKARATVPKGYVPGWAPPAPSAASGAAKTAAAKKNEKRRKKRKEKAETAEDKKVRDDWEDEEEDEEQAGEKAGSGDVGGGEVLEPLGGAGDTSEDASSARNKTASTEADIKDMASKLDKLQVT